MKHYGWTWGDLAGEELEKKRPGSVKAEVGKKKANPWAPYRNGAEARYAEFLNNEAGGKNWHYEKIKLEVAKGAWYTPDFMVHTANGTEIHELKGFWREAAKIRWKVVKERYPFFRFRLIREARKGGFVEAEE